MSEVITAEEQAKHAAEMWKEQYFDGKQWGSLAFGSSQQIYRRLVKG